MISLTVIKTYLQKPDLLVWPIFIFSLATFAFYVTVFFMSLNSLVSDYSWGDIVYHHQIFYNFLHGRPFQTSVYWHALVNSINPYAYLNTVNIHLYLSPFLFSPIYFLVPNLNGLYFTVMAVSYASLAFFLWKLVCLYTMEDRLQKYVLVMSFVLANAFIFSLIVGKASPILLGLPFLLAAYYFLQRERYVLYYMCSLLFCLSYDDCGFVVYFLFSLCVFLREKTFETSGCHCSDGIIDGRLDHRRTPADGQDQYGSELQLLLCSTTVERYGII